MFRSSLGMRLPSLGLSRLYSLVELDLSGNLVSLVSEVCHLGSLPCLEAVDLSHNPVTQVVDYRPHALIAFGVRASEVSALLSRFPPVVSTMTPVTSAIIMMFVVFLHFFF